jgi:hypothetical protein
MNSIVKKLEKGQKVKYVGKGFLGWNPEQPFMSFVKDTSANNSEVWVDYNGYKVVVRIEEIEIFEN